MMEVTLPSPAPRSSMAPKGGPLGSMAIRRSATFHLPLPSHDEDDEEEDEEDDEQSWVVGSGAAITDGDSDSGDEDAER